MMFRDRKEAGELLGAKLLELLQVFLPGEKLTAETAVVLGLPRGGVPVAKEVAEKLGLPLDVTVVRKIGVPGQEELAMGAVASADAEYLNDDVISSMHIDRVTLDRIRSKKKAEVLQRESAFMAGRQHVAIKDKVAILVDDGLATGASMMAAVLAIRAKHPRKIIVAVPVSPAETVIEMRGAADFVVCLTEPQFFFGVGGAYHVFAQTSDEEVMSILKSANWST
jgi:predicted phosphoribosyltransferase